MAGSSSVASTSIMDIDGYKKSVLAPPGTVPSVHVNAHPLVLLNISEHWTRTRAQNGRPQTVFGAVIGKQTGRLVELLNSYELVTCEVGGSVIIDDAYYQMKSEQFKQVFPDFDMLGWYSTGEDPTDADIKIHKQICQFNESPILFRMDPLLRKSETVPIKCYESVIDIIEGEAVMLFVELNYSLVTEDAERIGVDHVARISNVESSSAEGEDSLVTQNLTAQHSAIKMLASRLNILKAYLQAISDGEVEPNHAILRECNSICHRLPILNTKSFQEQFFNQCNDVELMAYLGIITQGCQVMNQFVSKFNVLYDRVGPGGGRRGRSLPFVGL